MKIGHTTSMGMVAKDAITPIRATSVAMNGTPIMAASHMVTAGAASTPKKMAAADTAVRQKPRRISITEGATITAAP